MPRRFDPSSYTKHLYGVDEVLSCLQKAVRRCQTDAAAFWAGELHESGLGHVAMNRLLIMTVEDIGIASPHSPEVIAALRNLFMARAAANWG